MAISLSLRITKLLFSWLEGTYERKSYLTLASEGEPTGGLVMGRPLTPQGGHTPNGTEVYSYSPDGPVEEATMVSALHTATATPTTLSAEMIEGGPSASPSPSQSNVSASTNGHTRTRLPRSLGLGSSELVDLMTVTQPRGARVSG